ncbi:MAG: aminopeptidase P family N-terminal domain-containing protein, partial [Clostridia bacterium]|nr:aminopeptidase P family N-terminal domain-containing protein [Clostridia bacterium]
MNYPTIESKEFSARVEAIRAKMNENGVDLLVGFSNLLEIGIVRYYCGFAPVNESSAIVIPAKGQVVVCSGQASYDYCLVQNKLPGSRIAILPEIGEVSGFEYDTEGQLDFEELFAQVKAENPYVKKIGFIGRLIFPSIIMNKLKKVFAGIEVVDFDDVHYEQRIIKSAAEIECLKTNWAMVSEMFTNVVPKIEVGMTERHIEGMFEAEMMRLGAESYVQSFAPMVATGPKNSYISMCRNTLRKIEESEII